MREVLVQARRMHTEVKHQRNERLHGSRRRVAANECMPRSVLSVPVAAASSSTLRGLPSVDNAVGIPSAIEHRRAAFCAG